MCLAQADHRPAHLTRVHQALISLPEDEQVRLGVIADWKHGPHQLTYRQTERTFGLVAAALGKDEPDGLPSGPLQHICDDLLEASVPGEFKNASTSLAVDWTDLESFSRPPPPGAGDCADPEASWGHRKNNLLRSEDELFYGWYLSAGVMMPDEHGPAIPEFARRATVSSCRHDPVRAFAPVLTAMPAPADPARRHPRRLRLLPPRRRRLGHPAARRRRPARPGPPPPRPRPQGHPPRRDHQQRQPLLPRAPPPAAGTRAACPHRHQRTSRRPRPQTAELARYKLGRLTADDEDGYHRVPCPAAMGKIRCPLRPPSMTLDRDRPEILTPPEHPQACCTQQTITVPPEAPPKPRRNTTTRPRPTAAPTPAAPAPNAASPPPKTPPATPSPAAGAASWAWHPSCCSPQCCSPSATSASSPPGTPARKTTPAVPPPACHRKPADAAARPSRHSPQGRPSPRNSTLTSTDGTGQQQAPTTPARPQATPRTQKATTRTRTARSSSRITTRRMSDPNVKIGLTET